MKHKYNVLLLALLLSYTTKAQVYGWSELGGLNGLAANSYILSICSDRTGNIYAAGYFTDSLNADSGKMYVAKYNGTAWSELSGLNALAPGGIIKQICSDPAGNIYAAGQFVNDSGNYYVAKYDGNTWSELGGTNALAANNIIFTICSDPKRQYICGRLV